MLLFEKKNAIIVVQYKFIEYNRYTSISKIQSQFFFIVIVLAYGYTHTQFHPAKERMWEKQSAFARLSLDQSTHTLTVLINANLNANKIMFIIILSGWNESNRTAKWAKKEVWWGKKRKIEIRNIENCEIGWDKANKCFHRNFTSSIRM